ncbi:MAG TPA: signal recognition particle protein [Candidatus Bipolaricaulota bacterium]
MFEALSEKITGVLNRLKRRGALTEADIQAAMREVRLALLEADVNYKVVKRFVERLTEKALGAQILQSLTPGQQVVKLVRDELTATLGGRKAELDLSRRPTVIMLVGLQGSGKTTMAGKLGLHLHKRRNRKPLLVAADVQRPAAIEQLKQLGTSLGLAVFSVEDGKTPPLEIVKRSLEAAQRNAHDVVVLDTAGRLQIDDALMDELVRMKAACEPSELLLVADAMTGQEAVNIAQAFHDKLTLSGIVLTKMDGDARGGAALSMVEVTGVPIKLIGVGEKPADLEEFHPDRLAERILGMGDMLGLIEQAEAAIDPQAVQDLEQKLRKQKFSLQDFLDQLQQMRKLGPLAKLLEKIPGMNKVQIDEKELARVEAIIRSMTRKERVRPELLDASRKKRVASGSGTQVSDVNRVLKRFQEARKLMQSMGKMKLPPGMAQR